MTKFVIVTCFRDGREIAEYQLGLPETIGLSAPPDRNELIAQAKSNLTTERKAGPPYEGIEFKVRYL